MTDPADSQPDDLTGARTTVDNTATSTDTADNPLRQLLADAVRPWLLGADEADIQHCAAVAADAILPTTRLLGALHKSAHDDVTRVINLYERWVKAGPPPIGTPTARWWDQRLAELRNAILPTDQPAGDNGPSVAEAASDDRRYWNAEREGE